MCKFCELKRNSDFGEEVFRLDLDFGIFGRCDLVGQMYKTLGNTELMNLHVSDGSRGFNYEIKIKYCPMCGRKLEEGEY